jgi:hypothetical protein
VQAVSEPSGGYRAIRTKIGEALRGLVPKETPPKRLLELLKRIKQPRGDDTDRTSEQQSTESKANKFEK